MELTQMFGQLWRYRLWSALALVVAVIAAVLSSYDITSSGLRSKTTIADFGAAQGQFTIDTNRPTLTGGVQAQDLIARARIIASFVGAPLVKREVAKAIGINASELAVSGPTPDTPGQQSVQPVAQQRANQLVTESSPYSVYVDTDLTSPTVSLFVQADTRANAVKLANAVPAALSRLLKTQFDKAYKEEVARLKATTYPGVSSEDARAASFRQRQALSSFRSGRTVIRPLGQGLGGTIQSQSGKAISLLVGIVVLLALWALIVVVAGLRIRRRAARRP